MWRIFFAMPVILFISCASPSVVTIYKNRDNHTSNIHAVLVAGVINAGDSATRSRLENYFAYELSKAGYNAATSLNTFGLNGLGRLGQEETMKKLCDYGFDAVMTIALVDGAKEKYKNAPHSSNYVAGYYFDRIWNYNKIAADLSNLQYGTPPFWECILFDLYSLRPLGALQTQLFAVDQAGNIEQELAKRMIAKMMKEKIIRKRNGAKRPPADLPVVKQ